ncbi:MAG: hypothetical protein V4678_00640 [Patescibacteria group bacterium]
MNKWDVVMIFMSAIPDVARQYLGMVTSGDPESMIIGIVVLFGLAVFFLKRIRIWVKAILHTEF